MTSWRKSSYSTSTGGECVEISETPEAVLVRDTQNRAAGHLVVPREAWAAFLTAVKSADL
ncbi:DUF397 domain-containing protein [Streptomonospora nanhaiensis]|uniref:DUF397 domain-containing protein n=1 Tax=Streptomonospora nanhaiensis TaxID=1323731 RepID=A0A853BS59_9ACTN|nr:DUF397 domain-containing protein [Streptomonospora nanhaiensis]MBX9390442.1 DUF397 domain-containing protein [Streptomonospora nanhaiensis]NYI97714.1 hypothetical protein [Streptomonospora nanhaiensis]